MASLKLDSDSSRLSSMNQPRLSNAALTYLWLILEELNWSNLRTKAARGPARARRTVRTPADTVAIHEPSSISRYGYI